MSLITDFVKELRDYAIYLEDDLGNGKTCDLLRKSADTIEELSAKVARQNMERSSQYYGGGWIPVEEMLPEDGQTVLATHLGGLNPEKQVIEHVFNDGKFTLNWYMDTDFSSPTFGERYMGEIIAWRPLPPAFEPKED